MKNTVNTLTTDEISALHSALDHTNDFVKTSVLLTTAASLGFAEKAVYKTVYASFQKGPKRGQWRFPTASTVEPVAAPVAEATTEAFKLATTVNSVSNDEVYIPNVDTTFVSWGEFKTVTDVIKSGQFFPLYISGMSGNGKTFMVEQACAKAKREYVRVQISPETDEDDLIGGFRLINGETVFQKGPVVKAMERGAILLIDEIDRSSNKIMCLQGICEGKPVLMKKTGEVVSPAPGFNVIATANTKGRGSDDGRYSAATIIDDAFLERFTASIDQGWPTVAIETKILKNHTAKFGYEDNTFVEKLVAWANVIRKTFEDDAVDDVISTRRLCHIIQANSIFKNHMTAITKCTNRFDEDTRTAFLDLYTKIDENAAPVEEGVAESEKAEPAPF